MISKPLVTVVLPTRDRPGQLVRALSSVLAQTIHDLEVIVIDDGSLEPPDTTAVADDRVHWIRHPYPLGAAAVRNAGIRLARTDLVAFLDDDDVWHDEKIALQLVALGPSSSDTALSYCGYDLVATNSGELVESVVPDVKPVTQRDLLQRTFFGCSVPLIRRQCLLRVGGFDEHLPAMSDRDLWFRLAGEYRLLPLPRKLVTCYLHGQQITTSLAVKIQAKVAFLDKHANALAEHPIVHAQHWWRLGMLFFAQGNASEGRRCLQRSGELGGHMWRGRVHDLASRLLPGVHARLVNQHAFRGAGNLRVYC